MARKVWSKMDEENKSEFVEKAVKKAKKAKKELNGVLFTC